MSASVKWRQIIKNEVETDIFIKGIVQEADVFGGPELTLDLDVDLLAKRINNFPLTVGQLSVLIDELTAVRDFMVSIDVVNELEEK